jgi:DNA-binding ferritin-like protein (Dps family)
MVWSYIGYKLREENEDLKTLCAEAMGEQEKDWRDRFREIVNRDNK